MRTIIANCRFICGQLLSQQQSAFAMALLSSIALAVGGAIYVGLAAQQREQMLELSKKQKELRFPRTAAVGLTPPPQTRPMLPKFQSAEFARGFQGIATEVGLEIDETAYVLDSSQGQPFVRYRLSLTVKTRYVEIWKFVAALESAMPYTLLDSVRCRRENAAAVQLTCDLAFSALFAKP